METAALAFDAMKTAEADQPMQWKAAAEEVVTVAAEIVALEAAAAVAGGESCGNICGRCGSRGGGAMEL